MREYVYIYICERPKRASSPNSHLPLTVFGDVVRSPDLILACSAKPPLGKSASNFFPRLRSSGKEKKFCRILYKTQIRAGGKAHHASRLLRV